MNPLDLLYRVQAFRTALKENRRRMQRMAWSWCQDRALAEDLVQEALTKAFKNLGQLREPAAMRAWLYDILTNCWRDHLRRLRVTEDITSVPEDLAELTLPCGQEEADLVAKVRAAVAQLPLGQREVLTLVELEGFSYAEVAKMLDIPEGTVRSRMCRARETLRELLIGFDANVYGKITRFRRIK